MRLREIQAIRAKGPETAVIEKCAIAVREISAANQTASPAGHAVRVGKTAAISAELAEEAKSSAELSGSTARR